MVLPGEAAVATSGADPHTWILGTRDGPRVVARERARAIAKRLGARLTYAEPNVYRSFRQRAVPDDPLTPESRWRDASFDPALAPPPVTPTSPLLAVVDAKAQVDHPEFAGGNVSTLPGRGVKVAHGTQTLGIAVAPQNGVGIVGAYPGARAVNVALPPKRIRCSDSARGIRAAIRAGAAVINMSYGSVSFCNAEYEALQLATRRGITLVAAGGNERENGNPYEFPASLPHVLTVGALTPDDRAAFFSNTSAALDLVAPGVGLIAPTPADGYETVDGTSFAAPIVAAAAIWVRTARPELTVDQVAQVLRLSAKDIFRKGYDTETGYGKLNMAAALAKTPPDPDPLEPNEDFAFVDGRAFGSKAEPIWTGGAPARLTALLDRFEDPGDVYRIRVPGRRSVTVTVRPEFGNPDLEAYRGGARTAASSRGLLAASRRSGSKRTERVKLRNGGAKTRTALIRVYVNRRSRVLDSRYALTVK